MNFRAIKRILLQSAKVLLGIFSVLLILFSFNTTALLNARWLAPIVGVGACFLLYLDMRVRGDKQILVEILGKIRGPLKEALQIKNEYAVARDYARGGDTEGTIGVVAESRLLDDLNLLSWVLERWQAELGVEPPEHEPEGFKAAPTDTRASTDRLFK